MLSKLQTITINNYKKNICNKTLKNVKIFENTLFLKQQINKPLTSIIIDPNNYLHIKKILFHLLPNINNKKINDAFIDLENHGFNSFNTYILLDKSIKDLLNTKYNFLLKDKYYCPYFKICSNTVSPIFTTSSDTILNHSVLKFLQLVNNDLFVPYTIFNNDSYTNLVMYEINDYIQNILIATDNVRPLLTSKQILLLSNLSTTLISSFGEFLNIDTKNLHIDLILYMSSAKKICPGEKHTTISFEHVNSGSTTTYGNTSYADPLIKIYRTEELVKVLFHELIHACKFDKIFDDYPKHTFKVTRDKLLFTESITECFARIMNIILYSHIYNTDFNKILNYEITFGLIQTAKILNNYGFMSIKDFLNNDVSDERVIKQETSAFEYYILTTILLINVNEFLTIIKNKGTIKDIIKLIDKTFNDNIYQTKVNNIINNIDNMDDIIIKTCKMTVIKINLLDVVNYNKCKNKYLESKKNEKQIHYRSNM
jgi:hypothetical protein